MISLNKDFSISSLNSVPVQYNTSCNEMARTDMPYGETF